MKVTIIHGSPKGNNYSTTKQYTDYIRKHITEPTYTEIYVGKDIKKVERDTFYFNTIIETIADSDVVIWAFPVYYFMVPSQLKRFIELVYERSCIYAFRGKYSTTISTSANFFDHTAHNYINAICNDLDMNYIEGFPAEMSDLFKDEKRKDIIGFAQYFLYLAKARLHVSKVFTPLPGTNFIFVPETQVDTKITVDKKIVLLTDATSEDLNLNNMIKTFTSCFNNTVDVINLHSININGGCLGCAKCFKEGKCIYKDGYEELFYEKINTADVLIFAGTMKDRYLSSTWKVYFDRNFFNGHRPVLNKKYLGFIISGPLKQNSNLRQILEGISQIWMTSLLDIITDEFNSSRDITKEIEAFAQKISKRLENPWERSASFLGIGGHKVFRDFVYVLKGFMEADHRYYKLHGLYDFPQKKIKERLRNFILFVLMRKFSLKKNSMIKYEDKIIQQFKNIIDTK